MFAVWRKNNPTLNKDRSLELDSVSATGFSSEKRNPTPNSKHRENLSAVQPVISQHHRLIVADDGKWYLPNDDLQLFGG